jgi:saccharopine dehydrogenase (NAD+, L-lysine-forming)
LVARLLAEHTGAALVLLGRRRQALSQVRQGLPDPTRAEVRAVDATDPRGLRAALSGVDVVVVTAPLIDHLEGVLSTVAAAGCDWVDVLLDGRGKWAVLDTLGPSLAAQGRCVVTGCGLHPGLAAVLVRALASRIPVERAEVAQLIAANWADYRVVGETVAEFGRELVHFDSSGLVDGQWRKLPVWRAKTIDFGAPFGRRGCVPMGLAEMRRLGEALPGMGHAVLYMAGFNPVTDWLVMPVCLAATMVSRRLAGAATRLLWWSLRRFSRPPHGCVAQVVAEGGPSPARLSVRHTEGGYWLTAAVAAATVAQYLDGTIRTSGVHIEGLVTDPIRLLADLAAWGATVNGLD